MSLSPLPLSRPCLHSCRTAEQHELMVAADEHRMRVQGNSGAPVELWGDLSESEGEHHGNARRCNRARDHPHRPISGNRTDFALAFVRLPAKLLQTKQARKTSERISGHWVGCARGAPMPGHAVLFFRA